MFSCLLLHSGSATEPLLAQELDVDVQVVGLVGRGGASARYVPESDLKDAVLYVPSMIAHREATRQQLRLTDCRIELREDDAVCTHSFQLAKAEVAESPGSAEKQELPEYGALKRHYKDLIATYCGSISPQDVMLHVGRLPAGSELDVQFKFLVRFSSAASASLQYRVLNRQLTRRLSYVLSLASPSPVEDVTPIAASVDSRSNGLEPAPMDRLRWELLDKTRKNAIQVTYELLCSPDDKQSTSPTSSGFAVRLQPSEASLDGASCYTNLVTHLRSPEGSPLKGGHDGVMMLSSTIGRGLLPNPPQPRPLYPSEFVFVVDCSGSMSGSNIQAAADTLITCIKSLPVSCHFNVVAFGSTYRNLFPASAEYTQANMERAVYFANQLQANLGGTELLAPLRWIFKQRRSSRLPCQVFVITDGGVNNTQAVVHSARKNRHQARCHTFGIGSDVCVELVTGIAAASGGRSVLLANGERLQTKVVEVLKQSLQAHLMDTVLRWKPPQGFSIAATTPKNLGTVYSGNSYSAFAFLKRHAESGVHDSTSNSNGSATIIGLAAGEEVEIPIADADLPSLSRDQEEVLAAILTQAATWSKLDDLEMQVLSLSRKSNHDRTLAEPSAKRSRPNGLNGRSSTTESESGLTPGEEMIELSLQSGIPCALTCFASDRAAGDRRAITQLLPRGLNTSSSPKRVHFSNGTLLHYQRTRKRKHAAIAAESTNGHSFSLTSLAKNSVTAVGSTLKSVVNFATLGLLTNDAGPVIEPGWRRMDDQIELQRTKDSQLYWDESSGQLVYPPCYYRAHAGSSGSSSGLDHRHHRSSRTSKARKRSHHSGSVAASSSKSDVWAVNAHSWKVPTGATATTNGTLVPTVNGLTHSDVATPSPALNGHLVFHGTPVASPDGKTDIRCSRHSDDEDDDDFTISDTESDSSVDPDWGDLQRPSELLPLLQMQLFNGAWPLIRAFSFAIGVPLEEVRKLPLEKCTSPPAPPLSNGATSGDETKAHFWTTALAVACLEEYFVSFRPEWELVAVKGRGWLEQHLQLSGLGLPEVEKLARELVLRQS